MIIYIIVAFVALFVLTAWVCVEYYTDVIVPVNREMAIGTFYDRSEAIERKIKKAKTAEDCRQIQSNIIGFERKYGPLIDARLLIQTSNKLWGDLDNKQHSIKISSEIKHRPVEIGTLTIDDLIKT